MKRERYSIIYSSKTGNTKKLAEAIYNTLPQNKWRETVIYTYKVENIKAV